MIIFVTGLLSFFLFTCNPRPVTSNVDVTTDSIYSFSKASADGIGKFYFGREIAHVMGAGGSGWLERAERAREEGTRKVIDQLPLNENSVVADIGAGTGYYAFKIAEKVTKGKVYAVEIQDEFINYLQQKITKEKHTNVFTVKGAETSPNLPANSIDLAIMVDVYHELEYPREMLQSLKKALKPGGQLLLLEYKGEDPSIAIKPLHKMTVAQTNKELEANGFEKAFVGDFLPIQHYLLYKKTN